MSKKSKRKLLFMTLLLTLLLVYSAYAVLIPNVHAAEVTNQQKGLSVLNDAVGFDLAKYTTASREYPQEPFMGVTQSENVGYTLESIGSKVKLHCTFTNGALHILQVLEREGTPILTKSVTDARSMAKDFLSNYQQLSDNSFYGELSSTLNDVDDTKNSTTVRENTKFEVTTSENSKSYVWSYTFNGIEAARKCVALTYKDGFLKNFVDTWDLYKIGSTKVNLSEEEAVAIAMEQAQAYSWKIVAGNDTIEINNFKVTKAAVKYLVFCNSINADNERGEDRLMLYPMWRIGVELDKYYPGDVFGIYVDIWADTGEIRNIQEAVSKILPFGSEIATIEESTGRQPNSQEFATMAIQNLPSNTWMVLLSFSATLLVIGPIFLTRKKNLPKRHFIRIGGVFFFILLSSTILSMSVSTANAIELKGRATVWGSLAPFKAQAEIDKQELICFYINNWFTYSSYYAYNYQGAGTTKGALLSSIHIDEGVYPFVATVWFDHGPGEPLNFTGHPNEWHNMLRDSNDLKIYDYEIGQQTMGKTYFAFINVCCSGNIDLKNSTGYPLGNGEYGNSGNNYYPIGMPYAWTKRADLNTDGYEDPDSSPYCYIGFPWGSAALDQEVDPDDYSGVLYYDWVFSFFLSALYDDVSVNDALDKASLLNFPPQSFGDTDLHTGFTAKWPKAGGGYDYGYYSTMEVYGNGDMHLQYPVDVRAYDDHSSYVASTVTIDGFASYGSTYGWVRAPPGTHMVGVQTYPDDWHTFTHFDGHSPGENPIAVDVNSWPTITAYYDATELPYSFVSGIYEYYGNVYDPGNLVGSQTDGQFAIIQSWGPYQYYGWISGVMNEQTAGHIFLYGYGDGPLYVGVSSDGSNWNYVSTVPFTGGSPQWIDCGAYLDPFNYILLTADPNYFSTASIDCIRVTPPTNYTLTVSSSGGGYTDPTGNIEYPYYTYAHVQAYAAPGWQLDHWLLDNVTAGNNPSIDVFMDDDHMLQAVFCETPPQVYHWLTVDAYDAYLGYGYPLYPNIYIDGNYAGTGYAHVQVTEGDHSVWVDDPVWNEYWYTYSPLYCFSDGYYNGDYRPVYSDTTITAWYLPW